MDKKYIIFGGRNGGTSAALRLRRLDEKAKITLFEKGQSVLFDGCGLPYYIGGVVKEIDGLLYQTPGNIKKKFNIDVKVNMEITGINRREKKVEVKNLSTGRKYLQKYDKLVLATTAEPEKTDINEANYEKIFRLNSIADTIAITEYIDSHNIKRAVITGTGTFGLGVAENLTKRGIAVTVIEKNDHVMTEFDSDMSQFVDAELDKNGVLFITGTSVSAFNENEEVSSIELSNGSKLSADIMIMGGNAEPEVGLAKKAGLGIGITGGILVDERQQTTDKDIYATGEVVEVECLCGGKAILSLATGAEKQGRIAADNICGIGSRYKKTLEVKILKLFDSVFARAGLLEKDLIERKENFEKLYIRSYSHAAYYPEAALMTIKIMFEKKTGRILGVQIAGREGVDKRIDVLSAAMRAGLSADKLTDLELAYAPSFGTTKDAVNVAGSVASDVMAGLTDVVHWHDIDKLEGTLLVDVRTKGEFEIGTIKGAINIPILDLRGRMSELPKNIDIVLFCDNGRDAYTAERMLKQRGYNVKSLSGGYSLYKMFSKKRVAG